MQSRTGSVITQGAKFAMGIVRTGLGEPQLGLRGLNLDVLQAHFRKGTHYSGQCTNHSLRQVLDPKQLSFSYEKIRHAPMHIFRLHFFPLHVRKNTIACHIIMGKRDLVH